MAEQKMISIMIPCFNEVENVELMTKSIINVMTMKVFFWEPEF